VITRRLSAPEAPGLRIGEDRRVELPPRVLLTGAAGRIGSCLRDGLRPLVDELVCTDLVAADDSFVVADLADFAAVTAAVDGVDAIVHLGAIPSEAPFADLLGPNVVGTYNLFEAARRARVRRVVFASSNHATGFYPVEQRLRGDEPVRPDTLYGVTKAYGEALGRLYADKFGLEVVCVRIGTFADEPRDARSLATWLSPGDAVRLFAACLGAPDVHFRIVYGISANRDAFWDLGPARELGYEPQDDAARFGPLPGERFEHQGGLFTARDFGGWAGG
jgi:uronate dehydrogenase